MRIGLAGQVALVVARDGPIADAVRTALAANGASVSMGDPTGGEPRAVVAEVLAALERLDVLIFISPALGGEAARDPEVSSATAAEMARSVDAADEYAFAASAALAATGGRIVVIGSVLGLLPARRDPLGGLADGALFQAARGLAMRLGPDGVRINALALGAISSGAAGHSLAAGEVGLLSHTAPQRPGTLQEVAEAMLFLVDPENSCMTGHILPVDGGLTAGFARDF
jgi:NAD(P)-dependent dehydrogenase (short-subunit alcohol dehydrogenase family)